LLCLRNARAFPLLPAALASVPFGFVLVRVRVRVRRFTNDEEWTCTAYCTSTLQYRSVSVIMQLKCIPYEPAYLL